MAQTRGLLHAARLVAAVVMFFGFTAFAENRFPQGTAVFDMFTDESEGRWLQDNSSDEAEETTSTAPSGEVIQTVTVTGTITLGVADVAQFTSDEGKQMLKVAVADIADVPEEQVEVTVKVLRRLAEQEPRRLAPGQVEVDYTITLPAADATTSDSQSGGILDKINNADATVVKSAIAEAAKKTGVSNFDISSITGVTISQPSVAKQLGSITDVPWINNLLELSCGAANCTINQLTSKCDSTNRGNNADLCNSVYDILQEGMADVAGNKFADLISSMCGSEATNTNACIAVFDYYKDFTTTISTSKKPKAYDDDGADMMNALPLTIAVVMFAGM